MKRRRQSRPTPRSSRQGSATPAPSKPPSSAEPEAELFLRAVEGLERVPDKDTFVSPSKERLTHRARRRPSSRSTRDPDSVLDLHGKKAEEARMELHRFMQQARRHGERTVLVITGKGLRSPGGISVIKEELERWVRREGATFLSDWSEAPRHLGGRGAYLLYLRR